MKKDYNLHKGNVKGFSIDIMASLEDFNIQYPTGNIQLPSF
jgi:hypothetical protein